MKTFKEVVKSLGNKSYPRVELRCVMTIRGLKRDVFIGIFAYDGDAGRIIPLDGDSYDINMLCEEWNEYENEKGRCLTVYVKDGTF